MIVLFFLLRGEEKKRWRRKNKRKGRGDEQGTCVM